MSDISMLRRHSSGPLRVNPEVRPTCSYTCRILFVGTQQRARPCSASV